MSQDDVSSSLSRKSEKQGRVTASRKKVGPRHILTAEQLDDLKKAFDSFDIYGIGWIGIEELRVAIRALGYEPKMESLRTMVAEIDKENKGKISFDDFLHLIALQMSQRDSKDEILKSFRLIDTTASGKIKFTDLKRVANELGENLNDEELHEMIQEAHSDAEDSVSFEDFLKINRKYDTFEVLVHSNDK